MALEECFENVSCRLGIIAWSATSFPDNCRILTRNFCVVVINSFLVKDDIVQNTDAFYNAIYKFSVCFNWFGQKTPLGSQNSKGTFNCLSASGQPFVETIFIGG